MSTTHDNGKTMTDDNPRPRGEGWEGLYVIATQSDHETRLHVELGQTIPDLQSRQGEAYRRLNDGALFDALEDVLDYEALDEAITGSGRHVPAHVAIVAVDPNTGDVLEPVKINAAYVAKGADVDILPFEVAIESEGAA